MASCKIIHKFTCAAPACESGDRVEFDYYAGQVPATPFPPPGWITLKGEYICPKHAVRIEIKIEDKK